MNPIIEKRLAEFDEEFIQYFKDLKEKQSVELDPLLQGAIIFRTKAFLQSSMESLLLDEDKVRETITNNTSSSEKVGTRTLNYEQYMNIAKALLALQEVKD